MITMNPLQTQCKSEAACEFGAFFALAETPKLDRDPRRTSALKKSSWKWNLGTVKLRPLERLSQVYDLRNGVPYCR